MSQTATALVNALKSFQNSCYSVSDLPIVYTTFNFIIATLVSYISFPIFMVKIKDMVQLLNHMEKIVSRKRRIHRHITYFTLRYAVITGFGATALIMMQIQGPNLPTAVICGFLGPYIMRERLTSELETNLGATKPKVVAEANEEIKASKREREKKPDSDYASALEEEEKKVRENLSKMQKK